MLFLLAFALGFVGYLPPGNINLTVVQLSVSSHRRHWQWFVLFAAIMEFIYCFACLYGMQLLLKQEHLLLVLNWAAVGIFLSLGLLSLLHIDKSLKESANPTGVKRGILVAIFNPLQIPFWMVWGVYVMQDNWLKQEAVSIALFSIACSLGTIAVLYMYAEAGKKLIERLKLNKNLLNRVIGVLLISLAIIQTAKLLAHAS
ncbi:MAG TPA: LysE family transporter [Chitinophagales bacterium]|nr:LysE family transporter [Chitinophagales bacterium]